MEYKIREEATYAERARRVQFVRQEWIAFRNQVEKDLHLDQMDGRLVFLRNVLSFARAAVVFLYLFQRCSENEKIGLNVLGLSSPSRIGPNVSATNKFVKLSWCTQFQFQIENLFKNILKGLHKTPPNGYWQLSGKLLDVLHLEKKDHALQVLNIIAHIRNSQHANGTHFGYRERDTIVPVEGVLFEFRHGEIVQCATWDHIAHAWLSILPILKQIYYHDRVLKIPGVLPYQFS